MPRKNVIRADLVEAVYRQVDVTTDNAAELVDQVIGAICETLAVGENVKLSGFGIFSVRTRAKRIGRNPKTREAVPIEPHQAVAFSASPILEAHVNGVSSPPSSICSQPRKVR